MSAALAEFARETGTELLFDQRLVGSFTVQPLRGRLSRRDALSRLLAGTGLRFRETGGTFILYRIPVKPDRAVLEQPALPEEPPVPEILIIGRRTQNADIRRTENDIQPYKVLPSEEVLSAHRDNVDQAIRSRETSNSSIVTPADHSVGTNIRSAVDLRGLGTARTLVLVDGRRFPSVPARRFDVEQASLNGIPLSAIDRIETLTGTAGGIYGPGALGGVVNLVLKRNYSGVDLRATAGISSRGDAATYGIEGHLGITLNHGRTSFMLAAGNHRSQPLRQGGRDFAVRQRLLQFTNDPAGYFGQTISPGIRRATPASNVITVQSNSGENLVLDPKYGGEALGSPRTFLPIGLTGTRGENIFLLRQNAGGLNFQLPDDLPGTRRFLISRTESTSGILSVRQSLGSRAEAYLDGLLLESRGEFEGIDRDPTPSFIFGNSPNNPFGQSVTVSFPRPDEIGKVEEELKTHRLTAGLLFRLSEGWSAGADYSWGSSKLVQRSDVRASGVQLLLPLAFGGQGPGGGPVLDPLASWPEFVAALLAYREMVSVIHPLTNRFRNATLRMGGPILTLPGGRLTGAAQLEWRREHVPESERVSQVGSEISLGNPSVERHERKTQTVSSAYTELRAPLTL